MMQRTTRQKGNILFLILLAVVLFAALSYAVTQSMRGGGKDARTENADAKAADILNYFSQLDTAIQRMMLTGSVKDYEINFYYQSGSKYVNGNNDNYNCTQSRCRVFDPAGGGVIGRTWESINRQGATGTQGISLVSYPGVGTDLPEHDYSMSGVTLDVCKAVNRAVGIGDVILFNVSIPGNSNTIPYQFSIPIGPVTSSANQTVTGLPAHIAQIGTFCVCDVSNESLCGTGSYRPSVRHILMTR